MRKRGSHRRRGNTEIPRLRDTPSMRIGLTAAICLLAGVALGLFTSLLVIVPMGL